MNVDFLHLFLSMEAYMDEDGLTIPRSTVRPRRGGQKEYRLTRSKIMDTIPLPSPPRTARLSKF